MHIGNGMYGLILVEPREGLPKVDREIYVMQSEFYTKGKYGEQGTQAFSMEKALHEQPDYVVFNGSVGALANEKAVNAKPGETLRIFVGNAGPSLTSSFHVIGEIFDRVYAEGGTTVTHNVQTTTIPAGGSTVVEFKVEVPGTFIMVDHAIFRAFNKGAIGMIKVEGPEDKLVYSGKESDEIYLLEGGAVQDVAGASKKTVATTKEEQIALGKNTFIQNCAACHQAEGTGIPGSFPPLAGSDFLNADKDRAMGIVKNGFSGKITVNGKPFDGVMPSLSLSDEQIANVLTFVYNSWGNKGFRVSPEEVAKAKTSEIARAGQ
jgi:nitrite reductase (NO-forming)